MSASLDVGAGADADAVRTAPVSRRRVAAASVTPALLVAVGYIDPGNWGTDIEAGAQFGTALLWVLVIANAIAVFLQYLAVKLGVATGSHLGVVAGRWLSRPCARGLAVVTVGSLVATDLAEFLGVVVALRILVGGALVLDIALGAAIVFGLLIVARRNDRTLERTVVGLIAVVAVVYLAELVLAHPGSALRSSASVGLPVGALPVAVGLIGATVMPHNLFLHSGVVHWRAMTGDRRVWLRRVSVGSAVSLTAALVINAAILVTTAATRRPGQSAPSTLEAAAHALSPVLGSLASVGFALALLAAGVAATITAGVAGDFALEGLTPIRIPTVYRRAVAVVPAAIGLLLGMGEIAALVASQIVLSVALPFVTWALVRLTNDRRVMGEYANRVGTRVAAWVVLAGLVVTNLALLIGS